MGHSPASPGPNRIDRLIDGALQEAAALSWDTCGGSGSQALDDPPRTIAPSTSDAFPGYQVLKEIRSGGQAVVYLGAEEATDRRVAIKAFHPSAIPTPKDRYRFEREVEVLQGLCHPSIVRILHADAGGERPYIVMEYIPGWNLDDYFREHDLDVRATMRMFRTITLAIHAAHQKGVIHRDIKPSNIRVDHNAEPHVFDFGLAKLSAPEAPEATMTETGQFLGTLHWVSPEQAEGRVQDVDVRTDVYSLGMVLYHMLTGELPFEQGGSMRDVLNRIATAEPVPPRKYRREIDDDVETIVLKCLVKEPERRYVSASELTEDVERWLERRPILAKRDSFAYVVRKFAVRHWLPCTLATGMLVAGTTLVIGFARYQTRLQRIESQLAASALSLVNALAPEDFGGDPLEATQRSMQKAISTIDAVPSGEEEAVFSMRRLVAQHCMRFGLFQLAYEQGQRSVEAARLAFGENSEEYLGALQVCARYALEAHDDPAARRYAAEAVDTTRRVGDHSTYFSIRAHTGAAWVFLKVGDLNAASGEAQEGLRVATERYAPDHPDLTLIQKGVAELLLDIGKGRRARGEPADRYLEQADALQQAALDSARRRLRDKPADLAHYVHSYAVLLREMGRLAEADPLAREAVELRESDINPKSDDAVFLYASLGSLGVLRMCQHEYPEAERLLLQAFRGLRLGRFQVFNDMQKEIADALADLYLKMELDDPGGGALEESLAWVNVASQIAGRR